MAPTPTCEPFSATLFHGTAEDWRAEAIRCDGFKSGRELFPGQHGHPEIWLTDDREIALHYACDKETLLLEVAVQLDRPFRLDVNEPCSVVRERLHAEKGQGYAEAARADGYDGLLTMHPATESVRGYLIAQIFDSACLTVAA
jgi:hypothetical protein